MKNFIRNKTIITLIAGITILILMVLLTGCTNKQIFDTQYKFDKAICKIGNEYKEIKLKRWNDYEGEQLQLTDEKGTVYLVSSYNCTLIED